ncbi:hypothetical protein [Cernens ardua]
MTITHAWHQEREWLVSVNGEWILSAIANVSEVVHGPASVGLCALWG